jgi:hypothetical protein
MLGAQKNIENSSPQYKQSKEIYKSSSNITEQNQGRFRPQAFHFGTNLPKNVNSRKTSETQQNFHITREQPLLEL